MKERLNKIKIILAILFVYITLFELIIPKNDFLPKPTILLESVASLFIHYSLFLNMSYSIAVLLFGIFFGYIIFLLIKNVLLKLAAASPKKKLTYRGKHFMFFLILIGFIKLWDLPMYEFEFAFAALFSVLILISHFSHFLQNGFPVEYYEVISNLSVNSSKLKSELLVKSFLPEAAKLFKSTFSIYFILIIIYEFVIDKQGLGTVVSHLLKNKDLSAFSAIIILLLILYSLFGIFFNLVFQKFIYWEAANE